VTEDLREKRVRIAAAALDESRRFFQVQVQDAHAKGLSLRAIAAAAGVSHEQVRRMISADQTSRT